MKQQQDCSINVNPFISKTRLPVKVHSTFSKLHVSKVNLYFFLNLRKSLLVSSSDVRVKFHGLLTFSSCELFIHAYKCLFLYENALNFLFFYSVKSLIIKSFEFMIRSLKQPYLLYKTNSKS